MKKKARNQERDERIGDSKSGMKIRRENRNIGAPTMFAASNIDLVDDNEELLQRAIPQLIGFFRPTTINFTDLIRMKQIFDRNDYFYTDLILRKIGSVCEEILIQCKWKEELINCTSIFEETYTLEGLCCSFNYFDRSRQNSEPTRTTSTGWHSGLMLTLNPMVERIQHSSIHALGIKVHIHNPFEYPAYGTSSNIASPGYTYFFQILATQQINTEKVRDLTSDERHCVFADEYFLTYHKYYYFSNCMVENYARYLYKSCGCVFFYHTFSDKPKCNITDIPCIQTFFKDYGSMRSNIYCPARCDEVKYRVRTTSTKLNNVSKALIEE
ncbi:hypothetical protein WA026_021713 [Henosepilachna vigintioctopunctata]|uniref:Sodium channel protein n=1 Tax=Henosepilachna vigintioctopunctata TaxID=420089 RepID=A0AAW1TNW4_9CUCU